RASPWSRPGSSTSRRSTLKRMPRNQVCWSPNMSPFRLLSAILCLGAFPALAAGPERLQNASPRQGVSLNGPWRVIVAPYESGYSDYRYKPQADGGFGANKKPQSKSDLIEYDFDTAGHLQVPGDWNTQRPELMLYEG